MNTPPFLMGVCLLFWGWQSGFLIAGAVMAAILESSRYLKARWDLSDAEVTRIWNFCALLGLAALVFAFTNNDGPSTFSQLWENPNHESGRLAGNASSQAAVALLRWLPFIFFLFAVAQAYSSRREFPLDTVWAYLRYRRKLLAKHNRPQPPLWRFNATWGYFILCLFAASAHSSEDSRGFFWGMSALVAWALWAERPKGFTNYIWAAIFAAVVVSSIVGQHGLIRLTRWADTLNNGAWLVKWLHPRTDPEVSRTSIGHIGDMKLSAQIVLRVTPVNNATVPTYLREATYRSYSSEAAAWLVGGGNRSDFTTVPEIPADSGRWLLRPAPTTPSFVHISCYLEDYNAKDGFNTGVLPLPQDCDHLEQCPAFTIQNNSVGTVIADGPGLMEFDADFGSSRILDSLPVTEALVRTITNLVTDNVTNSVTNTDLTIGEDVVVPPKEKKALDTVIAQLPLAGLSNGQKIIAVRKYLGENFKYSFWQGPPRLSPTNQTALSDFLLRTHHGHCEYFATATVLLLREMHIPARYAVGYVVHEPSGDHYVVRERDAHAWCLAWNDAEHSWQMVDSTPSSWIPDEAKRASSIQGVYDFFSWLRYQFSQFRYGQSHLRPYLLLALIPTLGYFLYQILFHRRRHKPADAAKSARAGNWPGLDSEFYELEAIIVRRGLERRVGESPASWLRRAAADPVVAAQREPLRRLLRLHYAHRFDPRGLAPPDRAELTRQAKSCLAAINGH